MYSCLSSAVFTSISALFCRNCTECRSKGHTCRFLCNATRKFPFVCNTGGRGKWLAGQPLHKTQGVQCPTIKSFPKQRKITDECRKSYSSFPYPQHCGIQSFQRTFQGNPLLTDLPLLFCNNTNTTRISCPYLGTYNT